MERISLPHSSTTIEVSNCFAINIDRQFGRLQYNENPIVKTNIKTNTFEDMQQEHFTKITFIKKSCENNKFVEICVTITKWVNCLNQLCNIRDV